MILLVKQQNKITKVKKTIKLTQSKLQTVFICALCDRSFKGLSLRRHLDVHRAKVFAEPFAVTGPHGFSVEQLQFLVRGVPEDDAIYVAEHRRFGGGTGDAEASSLAPLATVGRLATARSRTSLRPSTPLLAIGHS